MPYIGATEVTLVLPANVSIGTNTDPLTLGEVASIIFEVEAEVNSAAAAAGYGVPVSTESPYAFALMQRTVKRGAAAAVLGIIFPNMGGPGSRTPLASEYKDAYEATLDLIRTGHEPLIDAGAAGAGGSRELARSFEVTNSISPSAVIPAGWDP